MELSALEYLHRVQVELTYIRNYLYSQMSSNYDKESFLKFERVYQYVFNQIQVLCRFQQTKQLSQSELFSIYGYFLTTVKKFKRKIENAIKLNKTDYECFIEKYTQSGVTLVEPLRKELRFQGEKLNSFEISAFLDPNLQHHLYTNRELCDFAINIFQHLKVFENFSLDREVTRQLLYEISRNYNVIPYHNFTHAFQLFQLLFSCYEKSKLRDFVNQIEIFAALLAGLGHDLNHKGVNNAYKIKKSQKHNILTSEQAVLENMHCATFFNILQLHQDLNIIDDFQNQEEKANIKRLIITSILATDFSKHNKLVGKLTKRVDATNKASEMEKKGEQLNELIAYLKLNSDSIEDRRFMLNIFVHACDISNPLLQFPTYMNWSFLLAQEFNDQTIKEAGNGLQVLEMLRFKDMPGYYNGQTFFAKNMVFPLWKPIGDLFPELKYLPDQLERNLTSIDEEKKKL